MNWTPLQISSRGFNRQSVIRAIKISSEYLKSIKSIPVNGIAIFAGIVRSPNGSDNVEILEIISPPLPIKYNSYRCDSKFHTEIIESLFDIHKKYGYIVICNDTTSFVIVNGTQQKILTKVSGDLMTDTRRGGQSANRIARIRQEKRYDYKKRIIETAIQFEKKNIEGIIISGNAELPYDIQMLIINDSRINIPILGIVKTSNTNLKEAINETISKSYIVINQDNYNNDKEQINKVNNLIQTKPELVVFGIQQIVKADNLSILKYVVCYKNEYTDLTCERIEISTDLSLLNQYDRIIGVLYHENLSELLISNL